MKIIVTTSNDYKHIVPIFCYLFNNNWGSDYKVELVGYDKPDFELPDNFNFVSLGKQIGGSNNFSSDLRPYFQQQQDWFIWLFDDTFILNVDFNKLEVAKALTKYKNVGRINLTVCGLHETHAFLKNEGDYRIYQNAQDSNYRLSTQPSIWNKSFLLHYLKPGLTPWKFETQNCINDGWNILGMYDYPVTHNEGVRKHDLYDYNLTNIDSYQLNEMKELKLI